MREKEGERRLKREVGGKEGGEGRKEGRGEGGKEKEGVEGGEGRQEELNLH